MHFAVCIILNNDTTYCCCLVQKEVEIFALMDIIFSCQTDHLSSLNGLLTKCHTENTASKFDITTEWLTRKLLLNLSCSKILNQLCHIFQSHGCVRTHPQGNSNYTIHSDPGLVCISFEVRCASQRCITT